MGVLPQAPEIIFEVQMKMSNEKIARKKKRIFPTYKTRFFFFFFLFGPLLHSKLLTFSFLIHFKQFKMLQERQLKFYKSSWNFNSNTAKFKEFFG